MTGLHKEYALFDQLIRHQSCLQTVPITQVLSACDALYCGQTDSNILLVYYDFFAPGCDAADLDGVGVDNPEILYSILRCGS